MKAAENNCISSQREADAQAVMDHVALGTPLEPEIASRVRERSAQATDEIRKKHGEINIAVELIREIRDEE